MDILYFITNIPYVIHFINMQFTTSEFLNTICDSLTYWSEISKFMHTLQIPDKKAYLIELAQPEKILASFYKCGWKTFKANNVEGDDEFFYSHVLRFYLPKTAQAIFNTHKVGLRVFNMQGYGRRNKELKNTTRRFTNKKGNIFFQNLKCLWDIFFRSKNAY